MRRTTRLRVATGAGAALAGALLLAASAPNAGQAAAFWHPVRAWRDARTPIRVEVDRTSIPRGGKIVVTVIAPAATQATLWSRGAGEAWKAMKVGLDREGKAVRLFLEINSDLYLRASTGGRRSAEIKSRSRFPPPRGPGTHRALSFISRPGRRAAARGPESFRCPPARAS